MLDDEAAELRELLDTNGIDYYETPAGNWGISMPAIWLRDESQLQAARTLLDAYQGERAARAREEYERLRRSGRHRTLADTVRENPIRVLVYLAVAALVIYVSTVPFVALVD